jgi:hypothetical protein
MLNRTRPGLRRGPRLRSRAQPDWTDSELGSKLSRDVHPAAAAISRGLSVTGGELEVPAALQQSPAYPRQPRCSCYLSAVFKLGHSVFRQLEGMTGVGSLACQWAATVAPGLVLLVPVKMYVRPSPGPEPERPLPPPCLNWNRRSSRCHPAAECGWRRAGTTAACCRATRACQRDSNDGYAALWWVACCGGPCPPWARRVGGGGDRMGLQSRVQCHPMGGAPPLQGHPVTV